MIDISISTPVSPDEINALYRANDPDHVDDDWAPILEHSLAWVCARDEGGALVGFYNIGWDGGRHATIFDLNIHPDHRHKGFVWEMLALAPDIAKKAGVRYLHADFNKSRAHLAEKHGFEVINAAIMYL